MLLIQCFTSVLCFVLLIHKGLSTDIRAECREDVSKLFNETETTLTEFAEELGSFPLSLYFIPDDDLIDILVSLETPGTGMPRQIKRHRGTKRFFFKASAAIIQNHFEFGTESPNDYSVKFFVRHTDGREGTGKIVCHKPSCKDVVMNVKKHIIGSNKLLCLEPLKEDDHSMKTLKDFNGITVKFYGKTYYVFNAQQILSSLVRQQIIKASGIPNLIATEATLNDNMMTFKNEDGNIVAQSILRKPYGFTEVDIEYIEAATKIVNAYKKGMTFKK